MNNNFSDKVRRAIDEGRKCRSNCFVVGPTARCNKSSIYIFKW